jgi:hypothetical protein
MGAIVSTATKIREFDQEMIHRYQHMLPDYYTPYLTQSDVAHCQKHWEAITMDNVLGFKQNEGVRVYFDSCKMWLHSLLYHEMIVTSTLAMKQPDVRHDFINLMRAMVVVALKQTKDSYEIHDAEIKLLCTRIQSFGFGFEHFISFGMALRSSLKIMTSKDWTSQLEQAWSHLFSSIISICLPLFEIKRSVPTVTLHSQHDLTATSSGRVRATSYDHEQRMYTSRHNAVIFE